MAGNSFGRILRLTTFGESHGPSVGGILEGVPAGIALDEATIQHFLNLRRPGSASTSTARREADQVHIESGVFRGHTTGSAICFQVHNCDCHSSDYDTLADVFRPGHADWPYWHKTHGFRDFRGGGRSSGRETIARVAAGAIAAQITAPYGIQVLAGCVEFGGIAIPAADLEFEHCVTRPFYAASASIAERWQARVEEAQRAHDTLGGIVEIHACHVPCGLGEPVFDKLSALLAHGLMSVGAVKGIEIGDGFAAARALGSTNNDALLPDCSSPLGVTFASNHAGGILGGLSSGQDIRIRCAIKPIASIPQPQKTVDIHGNAKEITIGGRHDLSAIPRIVPVLQAMTQLVLADCLLMYHARESHLLRQQ